MSKTTSDENNRKTNDMRPEYDFSGGTRGKHFRELQEGYRVIIYHKDGSTTEQEFEPGQNVILLDPDLLPYFPDSESVNQTLRSLVALIPRKTT